MKKLALVGGSPVIDPQDAKFEWPLITPELELTVRNQLYESLSIYDRSGIFAEFEKKFSDYHGGQLALLSNSGTSAIFSMFEGIDLKPGDEVICPTYTFHATVSPIVYTGATPIFCDCSVNGNIDPDEIIEKIGSRTKAVIITHMWGVPCDMDAISQICTQNQIYLLEDCSHAHGAKYKDQNVGTFGDAAAWSLQGQKIISGGEGGIMITKHESIFSRALLQGHYNKRCRQEISRSHPLYQYALTGFGLKLRAHPLAIAIANQQFDHLDEWIAQKDIFARKFINQLKKYSFLVMPVTKDCQPSWYSLTMLFQSDRANGVSLDGFVGALHAEGLIEVDRPKSTQPLHRLPLFEQPNIALQRFHQASSVQPDKFENAVAFYNNAIKIPIWTSSQDAPVMDAYLDGFLKVCDAVIESPEIFDNAKQKHDI